jgi:hypothetical protein
VLLRYGRPSAILREITKVIIDAIDGRTVRRVAHVGVKIFEIEPALTNGDAAAAVPGIAAVLRVKAARFHAVPGGPYAAARQAVHRGALSCKATAAFRQTPDQIDSARDAFAAAVAATKPTSNASSFWMFWKQRNHAPVAEPFASEVYEPVPTATGRRATTQIASQHDALTAAIAAADPPR